MTAEKDFFGPEGLFRKSKKQFCADIIATFNDLFKAEGISIEADGNDPVATLQSASWEYLNGILFSRFKSLDDLIPLHLTDEQYQKYNRQLMEEGVKGFGTGLDEKTGHPFHVAMGEDGFSPEDIKVLLQLRALQLVCAPVKKWINEKTEFMQGMQGKLKRILTEGRLGAIEDQRPSGEERTP